MAGIIEAVLNCSNFVSLLTYYFCQWNLLDSCDATSVVYAMYPLFFLSYSLQLTLQCIKNRIKLAAELKQECLWQSAINLNLNLNLSSSMRLGFP